MNSFKTILLYVSLFAALSVSQAGVSRESNRTLDDYTPGSCTIFLVSNSESAFFCNNEECSGPNTNCWMKPSDEKGYGPPGQARQASLCISTGGSEHLT